MKLLYTITYYAPHISGLTRLFVPIAENRAKKGDAVTVLCATHDPDLPSVDRKNGVSIIRVPVSLWIGKGPLMLRYPARLWRAVSQADMVHIFAPQLEAGFVALIARLRGKPVLMTYVCSFEAPGMLGAAASLIMRVSHLVAGFCATRVVALSDDYAQQSRLLRWLNKKRVAIRAPIPHFPERLGHYHRPRTPYRIGFVGRICPEKNIGVLLEAIPHLRERLGPDFRVELVGPRDAAKTFGMDRINAQIEAAHGPQLVLRGLLSEEELDRFYREIDVLVLPSTERIEAYGLVQVEAMLRGTPCVTSDRPGMREPVSLSGFGALFDPGNPLSLAEKITEIVIDGPSKTPEPVALAALFDPETIFRQYDQLYREVFESKA